MSFQTNQAPNADLVETPERAGVFHLRSRSANSLTHDAPNLLHSSPFPHSTRHCILLGARRGGKKVRSEKPMLSSRYVVVSEESRWRIVRGGRRFPETYPSKTQAVCSAIAFAERDGLAGRRAEVMVRHEDGHFITEWVYGEDLHQKKAARLPLLSSDPSTR